MALENWILHLDLDAFFAAVEQRDKPSLRGKPVVVGGIGNRGVVATASYEARIYGIRSAMSTAEARRRCPNAAFLAGRFAAYSRESQIVMEVLRTVSPQIEPLSLDEAYVALPPKTYTRHELSMLAETLLNDVRTATGGLTASVGIAPNKLMAKLGSEMNKPNGSFIIMPQDVNKVLNPLPVRAIPGVGPATEARLLHVGVTKVEHVTAFTEPELQDLIGESAGTSLYRMARGIDNRTVEPDRLRKSVSIEDTFAHDIVDPTQIQAELTRLVERLVTRMVYKGLSGRTVSLKVRDAGFQTATRSTTLEAATHSRSVISAAVLRLLSDVSPQGGVRLLGVGVSGLSPWIQGDLFEQVTRETSAASERELAPRIEKPAQTREWVTGMDVHHMEHGDGWVWGAGLGRVTVRFESRNTAPGPIYTFDSDDSDLQQDHSANVEA